VSTGADGKAVVETMIGETKTLVEAARARERQLELIDPVSPEEMADAQAQLGKNAKRLAVLHQARENRRGRRPGSRNKRTQEFVDYLRTFGPDPAVTLMQIQGTPAEILAERSAAMDPDKRRLSYGDAQALRVRCAETLMPYFHGKQPVKVEVGIDGDFNLLIPGVNIDAADAASAAAGTFLLEADYLDADEEGQQ
jgi:hypothetical protein